MSIKNEKGSKMERKSNTIIWIPVNERIPKNNKKVLCFNGYRMIENSWSMHTDQDAEWFKKHSHIGQKMLNILETILYDVKYI
jgi:hypothetical protein